ncbi:hypothetical protein [Streptomyces mirabilis]|uniref:hypothetical protein n=1 Tax=Streptomyces mirabilis TaxID=68239 RepID=UPI00076599DF
MWISTRSEGSKSSRRRPVAVNACGDSAPDPWHRVVALFIQFVEAPARGLLPPSCEHDALYRAMLRAGEAGLTAPGPDQSS